MHFLLRLLFSPFQDIEVKMKQQLRAPAYIPPKKPEDILRSLVWLQGLEEEAISYITSNAELSSYDYGDTIVKQGECCDGIYLIISGMVKVSVLEIKQTELIDDCQL